MKHFNVSSLIVKGRIVRNLTVFNKFTTDATPENLMITSSVPFSDRKSIFQGHAAVISNVKQIK